MDGGEAERLRAYRHPWPHSSWPSLKCSCHTCAPAAIPHDGHLLHLAFSMLSTADRSTVKNQESIGSGREGVYICMQVPRYLYKYPIYKYMVMYPPISES